jgi:predicted transcriptional regulator
MSEINSQSDLDLIKLATGIVAAYVSRNAIPTEDLPKLIGLVDSSLRSILAGVEPVSEAADPVVPIHDTVTSDYLVCLEDGRKFKSLKRHLAVLGMTPGEYKAKWGLPADYPMVAANYSKKRSRLAKSAGLGRRDPRIARKREHLADQRNTVGPGG